MSPISRASLEVTHDRGAVMISMLADGERMNMGLTPEKARKVASWLYDAANEAERSMPTFDKAEPWQLCIKCSHHYRVAHLCRAEMHGAA